jgi:hypothetical protein
MAAGIDHAANAHGVAHLELGHFGADGRDMADDLVAGDHRIDGVVPFVARGVQVGMAHAAPGDGDRHVVRAGFAAGDREETERLVGGGSGIGQDGHAAIPFTKEEGRGRAPI